MKLQTGCSFLWMGVKIWHRGVEHRSWGMPGEVGGLVAGIPGIPELSELQQPGGNLGWAWVFRLLGCGQVVWGGVWRGLTA